MDASPTVRAFMDGLGELEATRRPETLAALFAPGAVLHAPSRAAGDGSGHGAIEFWERYLAAFGEVRSTFTRVLEGEGFAALEWESRGTLATGRAVRYEGVSILEHGGGRINALRIYYDSAVFLPPGSKHDGGAMHPGEPAHDQPRRDEPTGGRRGPVPVEEDPAAEVGRAGGTGGRKGHRPPRNGGHKRPGPAE